MLDVNSLTFMLVYPKMWTTLGFCGSLVYISKHNAVDYSPLRRKVKKVLVHTFLVTRDICCTLDNDATRKKATTFNPWDVV
jgi:hypothetical protein